MDDARYQRLGAVTLSRRLRRSDTKTFDTIYTAIGRNTGNYMFTEAVYRTIGGEVREIGFQFDPAEINETCDAVVVPAANWLNPTSDWSALTDRIRRLKVPVTLLGIGLQASDTRLSAVEVTDSAIGLVRCAAERSAFVSVRGGFTADWLETIGVRNVVVTGCPSLYMPLCREKRHDPDGGPVVQSTRFGITEAFVDDVGSGQTRLFALMRELGAYMVYQSEIEEMRVLLGDPHQKGLSDAQWRCLHRLYRIDDRAELVDVLRTRGRLFFDLAEWTAFVQRRSMVVGSRLHGCIHALNSGVPAALVAHDSRTAEMAEFAALPTMTLPSLLDLARAPVELLAACREAMPRFERRLRENTRNYRAFLASNGLAYRRGAPVADEVDRLASAVAS